MLTPLDTKILRRPSPRAMLSATRLITRRTASIPAIAVQNRAMGGHAQSFVSKLLFIARRQEIRLDYHLASSLT